MQQIFKFLNWKCLMCKPCLLLYSNLISLGTFFTLKLSFGPSFGPFGSPYSFGLLIYAFSIQNFENLLQKMTFSYCYIGHICLTFWIASLKTSMIFGGFGCRRTMLWTLFWTLCVPLYPLDTWYVHFQFKILKICSKN